MKYIVTIDESGKEELFTFSDEIDHSAMAEVLAHIKKTEVNSWHRVPRKPVSAGFINIEGDCYGHSESLGIGARASDSFMWDAE